jgi:non-specific serine/threonine protein kinase
VKLLSVPNIAQRLNDRFKILTGGSRTAAPRQQTLSALIDWSYSLLTPEEQTLFKRIGIFAGGFSLDAATSVCAGDGLHENDVVDLLWSLTDKSLVVADTGGVQERYRLLESTRAYALEKLGTVSERERLARRHGEYFRDQAQAADERWGTGSTSAWLSDVELDLDNYRATLEWSLTDGHDVVLGGIVAGVLERLWHNGGLTAEGRYWIGRAQASLDESAHPQVAARLWGALALMLTGGKRMHDCAQRALALYQSAGDNRGEAWALLYVGGGLTRMGRLEDASEAFDRALAMLRACGDKRGVAVGLSGQALNQRCRGDIVASRELYAQALGAFKALGNEAGTGALLGDLAELEFADGHVDQARRLVDEAIEVRARGKNATYLANGYYNKAAYCIALGDEEAAQEAAREGLLWARQAQFALGIATALQHFALIGALRRHAHTSARLIGYVNAQFKELGYERESTEQWSFDKLMAALREQLTDAEIETLAAEGVAWSEDQAVEEAPEI